MTLRHHSLLADGMIAFALMAAIALLLRIFSSARLPWVGAPRRRRTLRIEGGSGYERSCVCLDCRHHIFPNCLSPLAADGFGHASCRARPFHSDVGQRDRVRSEEHTSEL